MIGESLRETPRDLRGQTTVGRRTGARVVPNAEDVPAALEVGTADIRMLARQPGGHRGRPCREADLPALSLSAVEDPLDRREVVDVLSGLCQGPGEDADGQQIDAGQVERLVVGIPHLLVPLLGVVVPSVGDAGDVWKGHGSRAPFRRSDTYGWPRVSVETRGHLRTGSAVGFGVALACGVDDVEVFIHVHALELADVGIPLIHRALPEDELGRVLPHVVLQR